MAILMSVNDEKNAIWLFCVVRSNRIERLRIEKNHEIDTWLQTLLSSYHLTRMFNDIKNITNLQTCKNC